MFAQTFFKVKIWIILCLQDKSLLKLQGADEFATGINHRGLSFLKYNRISFRGHYNSFRGPFTHFHIGFKICIYLNLDSMKSDKNTDFFLKFSLCFHAVFQKI